MSTPSKKPLQPLAPEQQQQDSKQPPANRPYSVYRQGFLLKPIRGVRKRLVRYWFVLFEQKDLLAFLYFLDEDHYLERKKNEGFIRIDDATSIDVLPEYMGRKNAFCITTPRNKYYLVSESRYELHKWLLALHNAMDEYKQHTLQRKKRHQHPRQRAGSTSGGNAVSNAAGKTPPRIKPSRPAPPVPQNKKKENEPPSPSAAATMAPMSLDQSISPTHNTVATALPMTSPLDAIVAGLLAQTDEMNEVEYNMTEEEPLADECHQDEQESHLMNSTSRNEATSLSMPALNNGRGSKEGTQSPADSPSNSQENEQMGAHTMPSDGHSQKRSSRKRSSTKGQRSVSPPNLPPPPPPGNEQENEDKFLQVMNSFTDFGETLNEITAEMQRHEKPDTATAAVLKPMPPVRVSSLSPKKLRENQDDSSVKDYLEEAFQQEDSLELSPPGTPEEELVFKDSPNIPRSDKRTVAFQDNGADRKPTPSYEPRIDRETNGDHPLSVMEAKLKLFGGQEAKVAMYRRSKNIEDKQSPTPLTAGGEASAAETHPINENDDLVQSIETALESTSYMETPPPPPIQQETRVGFTAMVGETEQTSSTSPAQYMLSSELPPDENSISPVGPPVVRRPSPPPPPIVSNREDQIWSNTTTSTFQPQNPVYRSLV